MAVGSYQSALLNRLGIIEGIGTDATRYARSAADRKRQRQQEALESQANAWRQQNDSFAANAPTGGGSLDSFINAIKSKESGGNYSAVNKDSGALGAYQILPSNIASWSQAALGKPVSIQQFRSSPSLQDTIARYQLSQYYNQFGPAGAAVAWYAGPGNARKYVQNPNGWNKSQGQYPSVQAYVQAILRMMG